MGRQDLTRCAAVDVLEHMKKPWPVGLTGTHCSVHRRRTCNTRSHPKSGQSCLIDRGYHS